MHRKTSKTHLRRSIQFATLDHLNKMQGKNHFPKDILPPRCMYMHECNSKPIVTIYNKLCKSEYWCHSSWLYYSFFTNKYPVGTASPCFKRRDGGGRQQLGSGVLTCMQWNHKERNEFLNTWLEQIPLLVRYNLSACRVKSKIILIKNMN